MSADQDLRERTVAGISWRFLTVVIQFVLQFGVGVLLARLLPPEDFGLVGLALIVIGFGRIVNDLGLAESIIQRDELSERHVRVGFTCSVVLGLGLAALMYGIAPVAATFLGDLRVTPLLRFIGITFFFSGFGVIGEALLRRKLHFKQLMVVELISYGLGYGGVAIALALNGFGEWSLAWGHLVQKILNSLLAYGAVRHSIWPLLARREFMQLAGFGAGSSLLKIFNYVALQGDYFVIGRVLGAGPLGLYTRAYQLMQKPLNYTGHVLSSVLFPAVSRIQHQQERVKAVYGKAISITTMIVLPSMIMLVVLAPEIVIGLYGEKWSGTIIPLQVLAGFGIFRTTYHIAGAFVKARGFIYRLFFLQVIYAGSVIGGAWLGAIYGGINGAALAVGLAIVVMYLLVVTTANIITTTRVSVFLKMHLPAIIVSTPTLILGLASRWLFLYAGLPALLVFVAVGLSTALGLVLFFRTAPDAIMDPVRTVVRSVMERDALPEPVTAFLQWLFSRPSPYEVS